MDGLDIIVAVYADLGLGWAIAMGIFIALLFVMGAYSAARILDFIKEG